MLHQRAGMLPKMAEECIHKTETGLTKPRLHCCYLSMSSASPFVLIFTRYSSLLQTSFPLYFPTIPLSRIAFFIFFSFPFSPFYCFLILFPVFLFIISSLYPKSGSLRIGFDVISRLHSPNALLSYFPPRLHLQTINYHRTSSAELSMQIA
jgi:hypothetical protein